MPKTVPLLCLTALLVLSGCFYSHDSEGGGFLRTESRSIDLGGAETVHVELKMGAGDLIVGGGAQKLMEASFQYDRPSWRPDVRYQVSGLRGTLTVQQPKRSSTGNVKNQWKLNFNNDARMGMSVALGAGEGHLDLGGLALTGLDVEMGAGVLGLDLRGKPKRSYDVRIRGGVGDANIYVPSKVGVIADVKGGLGSISAPGFEKRGDAYVNGAYEKSGTTIRLDVKGGIGSINLVSE